MIPLRQALGARVRAAMDRAGVPAEFGPQLTLSKNPQFGDYQANGAMAAAKAMGQNPRQLAAAIVAALDLEGLAEPAEVAGPGFINIRLANGYLASQLNAEAPGERLPRAEAPQRVVVDYSSPNLAKEMHVGHIRSTIIGDAMVRILEALGHRVIRQNHVGDWGTQFGMLLAELETQLAAGQAAALALKDLEGFYQAAKRRFDQDPEFADTARRYVVALQGGDARLLELWQQFREVSLAHAQEAYDAFHISLTPADVRGESFYNPGLAPVVAELKQQGLAVEDDGAQVVFLQELADKNGNPSPAIVQKRDGGYLYATSDLAAIRFRVDELKADRIMVFSDARQSLHMQQVYLIARKAGWAPEQVSLEHHTFGTILGKDNKPFRTREGGTVKLADLLAEAISRGEAAVREKNPELPPEEAREVARKVGVGAIKYADLSRTRTQDYVFDFDQMLTFEGNTGPYLQYAYTRIQSIFRRAAETGATPGAVQITAPEERALALKLLQFGEVVAQVAEDALPHSLCTYLYDLASLFMTFYEACPILKEDVAAEVRASRLELARQVADTLANGLGLLGIEVMERM